MQKELEALNEHLRKCRQDFYSKLNSLLTESEIFEVEKIEGYPKRFIVE